MATYHCSFKHGGVTHAIPHHDYICRDGKYGTTRMKEQLVYKESGNLPEFANGDAKAFWEAADEHTRINGRAYEEFELALPQELTHDENIELVKSFIAQELGNKHAYTFAIHDKPAANDPQQRQIHVHLMYSPKENDGIERDSEHYFKRYDSKCPEKNGAKTNTRFSGNKGKGELLLVREHWEQMVNSAYRERGIDKEVSAKSLAVQYAEAMAKGDKDKALILDRASQVHMGPKLTYTTLREAAKHIDKEKFFLEKANPKARHNFLAQQQKQIAEQIIMLRRERILTLRESLENKANERSIRAAIVKDVLEKDGLDAKQTASKEIQAAIQKQLAINAAELQGARDELKAFRATKENWLLSDKKISQIANDIYTRGATKKLRAQGLKLKDNAARIAEIEKDIAKAEREKTQTPEVITARKKSLAEAKALFAEERQNVLSRVAEMKARLDTPKAQKATAEISAAIRQRVDLSRQRIADRQQRIENLRTQNFVLREQSASLKSIDSFNRSRQRMIDVVQRYSLDIEKLRLETPQERMKLLRAEIVEISNIRRQALIQQKRLSRWHVKEEFARNAARSVYTHGAYKTYLKRANTIAKLEKELTAAPADIEKQKELQQLKAEHAQQHEKLSRVLSTDHAQRSIERMVASRMEKNAVAEARQTILHEFADELDHERGEMLELKDKTAQELSRAYENEQEERGPSLLGQLRGLLSAPEIRSGAGMSASIRSDYINVKDKRLRGRDFDFD